MKAGELISEIVELQAARGHDTEIILVSPDEILVAELNTAKQLVIVSVPIGGSKKKATGRWKKPRNTRKRNLDDDEA